MYENWTADVLFLALTATKIEGNGYHAKWLVHSFYFHLTYHMYVSIVLLFELEVLGKLLVYLSMNDKD